MKMAYAPHRNRFFPFKGLGLLQYVPKNIDVMSIFKIIKRVSIFGIMLHLLSCSLSGDLREDPKAVNYKIDALPSHWKTLKDTGQADRASENPKTGAVVALNSVCERYQDSSLESLSKQLTASLKDKETLSQQNSLLDGRDSLWTRSKGQMDGVDVETLLVVYRKDYCLFDFSLLSKAPLSAEDEQEFTSYVKSFHFVSYPKKEVKDE